MLISAMTTKQIAESRGMAEQEWERYFTKRLGECLNHRLRMTPPEDFAAAYKAMNIRDDG
jgi:hypothetical protein